jgi:mRNA-degrading endonuclease RelE of RelBE toxin-antitoxin system
MEMDPFLGDVKPIKKDSVKGLFRRRVGDYRIAFTVDFQKDEVAILRVAQRENFYG